jgi:hypothetical protein
MYVCSSTQTADTSMMTVDEAIRTKRAVRQFAPTPLPDDAVRRPAPTVLAAVQRSVCPVYQRAPHNALPLEHVDQPQAAKHGLQPQQARRTPRARAPLRAAGYVLSFPHGYVPAACFK